MGANSFITRSRDKNIADAYQKDVEEAVLTAIELCQKEY